MKTRIESPSDGSLEELCDRLRELAPELDRPGAWPVEQLRICGDYGVYEWFVPPDLGGQGWDEPDLVRGYLRLSAACLTTTFVITQRTGACRRIALGNSDWATRTFLPDLLTSRTFATVGISHLTTSRRHLKPVLRAEMHPGHLVFDGYSPWVTGAVAADLIVLGGTLDDGREVLAAVPTDRPGLRMSSPAELVGLSASRTGPVHCDRVELDERYLLAGPVEQVMKGASGANTGGLQTSTLAVGLADAAIAHLEGEANRRRELLDAAEALRVECDALRETLLRAAAGEIPCTTEELRKRANSLVLRATQAALVASKGAGYVVGHPAGRWCREALFFLVWSCPQPVLEANLCELAGLSADE